MISADEFITLVRAAVPRFERFPPNERQRRCVLASPDTPLMIVAGPGSGKTTVLVLRALRLVFVDGLMPENVLITTFTKKAAEEMRSRLIEWGLRISEHVRANPPNPGPPGLDAWLEAIDVNRFITGTLDSICEDTLTTYRDPGDPAPVLVEGFVGNALLARKGMFPAGAYNRAASSVDTNLADYLAPFTRSGNQPRNFGEAVAACRTVVDRLIQDRVDISAFTRANPHTAGRECIARSLGAYREYMADTNRMDFAGLEEEFLQRLQQGRLDRFTSSLGAVLVDEYQDTNPLQESIYFQLVRQTGASLSVVGDDDQSLHRFRGATVELFCNFPDRLSAALSSLPAAHLEYLVDNYRSTPEVIGFLNAHITCDPDFQPARVQPPKPPVQAQLPSNGLPVLGMFRSDRDELARDLADFLDDLFCGTGRTLGVDGEDIQIVAHPKGGDLGDAVLIGHTVGEFAARWGNNPPRERLPWLLRGELQERGLGVFNPRGRALRDIPQVQALLGLLLECIDPGSVQENDALLRSDARNYLSEWRGEALRYIASDPAPTSPRTLRDFVSAWQTRTNQTSEDAAWPEEWPILELSYKLITWVPFFQDDPEGQVYLEAIGRCVAQAAAFSPYRCRIIHGQGRHDERSVRTAIMDMMVPIAENDIEVDEEIMPHVPRNRLPIMTIHQAKGLEFPLTIVDVASDFTTNHPKQRFRRFPEEPSGTHLLEDDLAPYCDIGPLRTNRTALDRAFDDLIRLYYVAYSRAQSALVLVGLDSCLRYNATIKHVATGWSRDNGWDWRSSVSGSTPVLANEIPLLLI
ncbi:MAG: UvrD-helicase domain-containing protein [Planctomycetota bacterium]